MLKLPEQRFRKLASTERVEVSDLLADRDQLYRHPDLVGDRECDPTLRRPVELGQYDPRDTHDLVEELGLPQAVLPRGRVYRQENLVRRSRHLALYHPAHLLELRHKVDLRV